MLNVSSMTPLEVQGRLEEAQGGASGGWGERMLTKLSCEDSELSAAVTTRQVQELSGQMSVKERRVR